MTKEADAAADAHEWNEDAWNGVGKTFAPGERVYMPELGARPRDFGHFEEAVGDSPIYARIRWKGGDVSEFPIRYVERVPEEKPADYAFVALILALALAGTWLYMAFNASP